MKPTGQDLHRLAREWFAELCEAQQAAEALGNRPSGQPRDGDTTLGWGLLDWLIADGNAAGEDD